jgi:RNA polymerase sigma-70 factor, ECF subfamily
VELPAAPTDPEAASRLYERHYARVLGFCRRRLPTPEDAEDAAQTTFTYALGGLRRGVVPRVEIAWLLKIARNVCLTRWDTARRRGRVEVLRDPHLIQELAPGRADADEDLIELDAALGRLTEQQRHALVLREWQGLSYREVGEALGLSQAAVESLLFRARRALARDLRGDRQLRSRIDVGSLLAAVKSLFTGAGAAVKVAAIAAAVATAGAVAVRPLAHRIVPDRSRTPTRTPATPAGRPATSRATHQRDRAPTRATPATGPSVRRSSRDTPTDSAGSASSPIVERPSGSSASAANPASPTGTGSPAAGPASAPDAAVPSAETPSSSPATLPSVPAPATPPAPTVSVPSLPAPPTVPGVDPPAIPSAPLPAVPPLPVDPPALPARPTVSTPVAPPKFP